MKISSSSIRAPIAHRKASTQKAEVSSSAPLSKDAFQPTLESHSIGNTLAMVAMGAGTGAIGIGGTTALGMGAIKSFMSGNALAGTGFAVASLAVGGTLGLASFVGAAMSGGANGDPTGFNSWALGGIATGVAAGLAIF